MSNIQNNILNETMMENEVYAEPKKESWYYTLACGVLTALAIALVFLTYIAYQTPNI